MSLSAGDIVLRYVCPGLGAFIAFFMFLSPAQTIRQVNRNKALEVGMGGEQLAEHLQAHICLWDERALPLQLQMNQRVAAVAALLLLHSPCAPLNEHAHMHRRTHLLPPCPHSVHMYPQDVNALPFAMMTLNCVSWIFYGFLIHDYFVFTPNLWGMLCGFYYTMVCFKFSKEKVRQSEGLLSQGDAALHDTGLDGQRSGLLLAGVCLAGFGVMPSSQQHTCMGHCMPAAPLPPHPKPGRTSHPLAGAMLPCNVLTLPTTCTLMARCAGSRRAYLHPDGRHVLPVYHLPRRHGGSAIRCHRSHSLVSRPSGP